MALVVFGGSHDIFRAALRRSKISLVGAMPPELDVIEIHEPVVRLEAALKPLVPGKQPPGGQVGVLAFEFLRRGVVCHPGVIGQPAGVVVSEEVQFLLLAPPRKMVEDEPDAVILYGAYLFVLVVVPPEGANDGGDVAGTLEALPDLELPTFGERIGHEVPGMIPGALVVFGGGHETIPDDLLLGFGQWVVHYAVFATVLIPQGVSAALGYIGPVLPDEVFESVPVHSSGSLGSGCHMTGSMSS